MARAFGESSKIYKYLILSENVIFSLIIIVVIALFFYFGSRKIKLVPARLQNVCEVIVAAIDDFVCGILGAEGRRFTPFIGTLFIYIFSMNLSGLIPFMKSPTTSWSTTLALALCVFVYVQYSALKKKGFLGYIDHLMGSPRGFLAFFVFIPILMFVLHVISELVKPISLSLRLRSNIWGDDILLAVLADFGIKALPLFLLNMAMAVLTAVVQAVVFCLLAMIYFTFVLAHETEQ